MDLTDTGRHLFDVDGSVLPGQPGLLVADDDGEEGGDGDLWADLGQSQYKEIRPAVPHQSHLGLVPEQTGVISDYVQIFQIAYKMKMTGS